MSTDVISVLQPIFDEIAAQGIIAAIARDPVLQFGTPQMRLLMANYLPRRLSDVNTITEDLTLVTAHIADDGDPMSPPQIKAITKGMPITVVLGHIDTAAQMSAREHREISYLVQRNERAQAISRVIRWLTTVTRQAISLKEEKQRCDAIANGTVTITPMNGTSYDITFPIPADNVVTVPSGTVAAPAGFYGANYNPILDFLVPMRNRLRDLGMEPMVIITSNKIATAMEQNEQLRKMAGNIIITDTGLASGQRDISAAYLDSMLRQNGLPPLMRYDSRYPLQNGSKIRFWPEDKLVMLGATGRSEIIEWTEERELKSILLPNTLGYYGVGTSLGQSSPGMVIATKASDLKPVGWYAEAYQESFPVPLEYEAIVQATIPEPTP
ncbi:MAG: hypothetical protein F6K14_10765 [Symploca sp. SIO2C1]|nr:hypothetical protein [Symploca sp. SIO2C1]